MYHVTVLIVGYNSEPWLARCLTTLKASSGCRLQLCFVDNLNNPTLDDLDLSAFDVEVLKTPRPMGFADANNFGICRTRFGSDITVFLNQDTVSGNGWIDKCASCLQQNANLGIVSPGLRTYDLTNWEPNLLHCLGRSGLVESALEESSESCVLAREVTAAAMAIRTGILRTVGPFDPIFGSYYEDFDLCRRVRSAGWDIGICPSAIVGHFSGSVTTSVAARRRRARVIIRNRLIHSVRESSRSRARLVLAQFLCSFPIGLVRGVLRTESSQPVRATLGAHWDLFKICHRLVSAKLDERCWQENMKNLFSDRVSALHDE